MTTTGTSGWSALPYAQRLRAGGMGDEAESVFEEVHKTKWVRFGFNRPPFRMTQLTSFTRHTPDYATSTGFLWDCMGLGRDGILKLKVEKFEALREWNLKQDTGLFVWNSSKGEYAYIKMHQLIELIWSDDAIVAEAQALKSRSTTCIKKTIFQHFCFNRGTIRVS